MKKRKKQIAKPKKTVKRVSQRQFDEERKLIRSLFVRKDQYSRDMNLMQYAITRLETTSLRSTDLAADALKLNAAISCREDIDSLRNDVATLRGIVAKLLPTDGLPIRLKMVKS